LVTEQGTARQIMIMATWWRRWVALSDDGESSNSEEDIVNEQFVDEDLESSEEDMNNSEDEAEPSLVALE